MDPRIRLLADTWNGWIWLNSWAVTLFALLAIYSGFAMLHDKLVAGVFLLIGSGLWWLGRQMRIGVHARMSRY